MLFFAMMKKMLVKLCECQNLVKNRLFYIRFEYTRKNEDKVLEIIQ